MQPKELPYQNSSVMKNKCSGGLLAVSCPHPSALTLLGQKLGPWQSGCKREGGDSNAPWAGGTWHHPRAKAEQPRRSRHQRRQMENWSISASCSDAWPRPLTSWLSPVSLAHWCTVVSWRPGRVPRRHVTNWASRQQQEVSLVAFVHWVGRKRRGQWEQPHLEDSLIITWQLKKGK